jgi:hypothetical protein
MISDLLSRYDFGAFKGENLNPYQLYRRMRPECFSDSSTKRLMTREMFNLQMENLSADMKQDLFEDLTRQLVCRLITPNLIPQTGPTGGGDGKTDIETHAVDNDVSDKWYYKDACAPGQKWAFAISCKKNWKPKMQSDVKKIVETGRGFTRIFFCTNQRVKSKDKSDLFESFKKEYQIETDILDYNWYCQSVFENGCYDIAIQTLNIEKALCEEKMQGPLDAAKEAELQALQEKLQTTGSSHLHDTKCVEDYLKVAILTRNLERPRLEVEARFEQALKKAETVGSRQQVFKINYQIGWTNFFWFENPDVTLKQYHTLKSILKEELSVNRVEKLFCLLNLIVIAEELNLFKSNTVDINAEISYWRDLHTQLLNDPNHSSSCLFINIQLLFFQLMNECNNKQEPDEELCYRLNDALVESKNHLDISFESNLIILLLIGHHVKDSEAFDSLINEITAIYSQRQSEISSAEIHYERGLQLIKQKEYKRAIKNLGQCVIPYQKETTQEKLIDVTRLLAIAFANEDLLYTAKIYFVKSLSFLLHLYGNQGTFDFRLINLLLNLCDTELRLGQLNSFLRWWRMLSVIAEKHPSLIDENFTDKCCQLDTMLSILVLTSRIESKEWTILPAILNKLGLHLSYDATLFKLGKQSNVSQEFKDNVLVDGWESRVFEIRETSPFLFDLSLNTKNQTILTTIVKGCTIKASFFSNILNLSLAEQLLAFIESHCATMEPKDVIITTQDVALELKSGKGGKTGLKYKSSNRYTIKINLDDLTDQKIWELSLQFLITFLSKNTSSQDIPSLITQKEKEEGLVYRLLAMSAHTKELNNVSFDNKDYLEQWFEKTDVKYTLPQSGLGSKDSHCIFANSKQSTHVITDLIDLDLWDKARWGGCGYMMTYDNSQPPILILLFNHYEFGKRIFEKWEDNYKSQKLDLKITIVTGIDVNHPQWYKVIIAPDMNRMSKRIQNSESRYLVAATRCHLMQSSDDSNMKLFFKQYECFGYAGITCCEMKNNSISDDRSKSYPRVIPLLNVEVMEAWTIDVNMPESSSIMPDDNPVIPKDRENDAPILAVLKKKKSNGI